MDHLASEYGWWIDDILEKVYVDQLICLIAKANLRKIANWRMQLAITTNPHVKNPKQLFAILDNEERKITGPAQTELDPGGFEALKQRLKQNPRFVVK